MHEAYTFVNVANLISERTVHEGLTSEIVKEETVIEGGSLGRESMDSGSANDDDNKYDYNNLETEDPIAIGRDSQNQHCIDEEIGTRRKIIRQPVKIKIKKERTNEDESDHSVVSDEESSGDQTSAKKIKTELMDKEEQEDNKKVVTNKSRKNAHTKSAQGSVKRNMVKNKSSSKAKLGVKYTEKAFFDMAPVSKTADTRGCLFTCSKCSLTVTSWRGLRRHMRKSHNAVLSVADVRKITTQASVHECKLCSEKILCDSSFLAAHMTHKHGITIPKYRSKYTCEVAWKCQQRELLEKGRMSEKEIGNMCTYRCSQCKRKYEGYKSLAIHARRCEKGPLTIRKHEIGKYILEVVSHKCKICSVMLFCDLGLIATHTKTSHGINTPQEYASKVGCKIVQSENETALKGAKKTIKAAGNFCTFTCPKCGLTFKSWNKTTVHLRTANHYSASGKQWRHYVTELVVHKCKICKKEILNDRQFINNHLPFHQVSFDDYVKNYK